MKKTIVLLFMLVGYLGFSQSIMLIHEKGGNVTKIPVDRIDKITYETGSVPVDDNALRDVDGNVYKTVKIGNQIWMAENLKTTKLRDGTAIQNITTDDQWKALETAAFCWFDNNDNNKNTYGALYNWHCVKTNKICPLGWHVPTYAEYTTLMEQVGGRTEAGGKLKEAGTANWFPPNTNATNEVGFNGLPSGYRQVHGPFKDLGKIAVFWTSTPYRSYDSYSVRLDFNLKEMGTSSNGDNKHGYSIRCVKD